MILYNALCGNTSPPYLGGSCGFGYDSDVWDLYCVEFSHTRKQGNKPAHLLAKYAQCIVDFITWMEENPNFIKKALTHDVSTQL